MNEFPNPFRPGAGHYPPYLAGRKGERKEFQRLLNQSTVLENMVLTGLRGVGKTVLLDSFQPLARERGWLWISSDLSESTSLSEKTLATRLCTDLAKTTSAIVIGIQEVRSAGFVADAASTPKTLDYQALMGLYESIPGLSVDKLKGVLELAWSQLSRIPNVRGIVFAYDEAQNLSDQPTNQQYPLALLLDCFQSLQKKGFPMMLALTGLPTLFPNLVESRTYSERMFRVVFLQSLNKEESEEAIRVPIRDADCPVHLTDDAVQTIIEMSGGYPYFIQFICREVYDAFIQRLRLNIEDPTSVPATEIEQKLDADFFAGRWARATDRQRHLMSVIAALDNCDKEFSIQEVVERSKSLLQRPFNRSHVGQMLNALAAQGLIYKHRHGKYSFAVPLMARFIRKQDIE